MASDETKNVETPDEPGKAPEVPVTEPEKAEVAPTAEPEKPEVAPTAEPEKAEAAPKAEPEKAEAAPTAGPELAQVSPEAKPDPEKKSEETGEPAAKSDVKDEAEPASEPAPDRRGGRHGKARVSSTGIVHVKATFSNTMVTITDTQGAVVSWSSGGRAGFKGSRKSTAFAATLVGQEAARQAVSRGMREVEVRVQGAGAGRESAVRALQASGMTVTAIKDVTPVPHNGCRPRKRRRV